MKFETLNLIKSTFFGKLQEIPIYYLYIYLQLRNTLELKKELI